MTQFMEAPSPVKFGSLSLGGANVNYFQDYKSEALSHSSMSPHKWGLHATMYSPKPDLVAAAKVRDHDQSVRMPPHNISMTDPIRMREIDDMYKILQAQRKQYNDDTGRLHPLVCFKPSEPKYQCAPTMGSKYLKYPESYVAYKTPPVLARTQESISQRPYLFNLNLGGVYSRAPCTAYKH